ncbi:MAG: hypothetical protein SNH27_17525 [Rikenellaceae bacterium]
MKSTEVTQQVPVEAATEKIVYTIPEGMESYKIYPASVLKAMGYYITTLRINRPLNPIALKLKRKSIYDCLGVLTPSLVVSALDCIEKGLEINMPEGVTDLAKVLVILDGAHRDESVNTLNKSKETSFENYYHLPINNNVEIGKTLRAINLIVRPWKGVDLVTSTLIEKAESGIDLSRLTWYQSLCGSMSEKVAWQWTSLSTNRPPIKSKVDKATTDDEILKEIAGVADQADIDKFNAGKAIFEELNRTLTKEELGWAEIPAFFIKKHNSMTSGKMDTNEAKELLLKFCKRITQDVAKSIRGYKGGKGRAENVTKIFSAQYAEFENKQA